MDKFQIREVVYEISGFTREYALRIAVPIDKDKIFANADEFNAYFKNITTQFENIRTLDSVSVKSSYGEADESGVVPVKLVVTTKDSWNIIGLPYPKFDSNYGFLLNIKLKDYNFAGTMQQLNVDLTYKNDEHNNKNLAFSTDFNFLFHGGPLDGKGVFDFGGSFPLEKNPNIDMSFGTGVEFDYSQLSFMSICFGLMNTFKANKMRGLPIGKKGFKYYMNDTLFVSTPFYIASLEPFGTLTWTPYFSVGGSWVFSKNQPNDIKGADIKFSHSLALGNVNWKKNFREGLTFDLSNAYSYNTFKKGSPSISFEGNFKGYISFLDRIGVYTKATAFYNLYNSKTTNAGANLRGILNKRINTDTAMTLNLDFPIKVGTFRFEEITGENWTRFFGFELHLVPFLDMAITHDEKTGRYFHPADGWYSGGLEVIVYPVKMRSIYVRMSLGFDLSAIKHKDADGYALRDGQKTKELFIGLGLHY